ncbi:MAG: hypothetical protein AVDCRST_MAG79-1735, partial [uncultured Thermoleophilia bacterium]
GPARRDRRRRRRAGTPVPTAVAAAAARPLDRGPPGGRRRPGRLEPRRLAGGQPGTHVPVRGPGPGPGPPARGALGPGGRHGGAPGAARRGTALAAPGDGAPLAAGGPAPAPHGPGAVAGGGAAGHRRVGRI